MDYDNKEELFGMLHEFSICVTAVKDSVNRYSKNDFTSGERFAMTILKAKLKAAENALDALDRAIEP